MTDFWSRRRAAVEAEQTAQQVALEIEERAQTEAELEARRDEDLLAEFDLPAPETLDSSEAVREFIKHDLPGRLKTRALRRLWRLNPVLANVDGLVDYGEDFTDSATVVENLQTAYQVGKGMLKHIEEMARQAEEADRPKPVEEVPEEEMLTEADIEPTPYEPPTYDEPDEVPAPRAAPRMRFQFEA